MRNNFNRTDNAHPINYFLCTKCAAHLLNKLTNPHIVPIGGHKAQKTSNALAVFLKIQSIITLLLLRGSYTETKLEQTCIFAKKNSRQYMQIYMNLDTDSDSDLILNSSYPNNRLRRCNIMFHYCPVSWFGETNKTRTGQRGKTFFPEPEWHPD